jgi:hypothetical protein
MIGWLLEGLDGALRLAKRRAGNQSAHNKCDCVKPDVIAFCLHRIACLCRRCPGGYGRSDIERKAF